MLRLVCPPIWRAWPGNATRLAAQGRPRSAAAFRGKRIVSPDFLALNPDPSPNVAESGPQEDALSVVNYLLAGLLGAMVALMIYEARVSMTSDVHHPSDQQTRHQRAI
jgi:hypothetical protein